MVDLLHYRSRGLDAMNKRFSVDINKYIKGNILELGFGEGKCLLELCKFPNVNVHGINNIKEKGVYCEEDLMINAHNWNISNFKLPNIYFYDISGSLRFSDNFFDTIISQFTVHYVKDKINLLEECWRVLKPGGNAFLHIDTLPTVFIPYIMQRNTETPRLIIKKNNQIIKFSNHLKSFSNITLADAKNSSNNRVVYMHKENSDKLNLGLQFNENATIDLLCEEDFNVPPIYWGIRSVYDIE
jgi:SAM-dependent methyltransferase